MSGPVIEVGSERDTARLIFSALVQTAFAAAAEDGDMASRDEWLSIFPALKSVADEAAEYFHKPEARK